MIEATPRDFKMMQFAVAGAGIFSTCSRRQYMAIVIDRRGHILGTGYNGVPSGFVHCNQGGCPRAKELPPPGSIYSNCYAIHAEANALLHSDYTSREDVTLYVNGPPCFDCAKLIANAGVRRLVYIPDDTYPEWPKVEGFLETANVRLIPIEESDL